MISAYVNHGQGLKDSLLAFGPYYFILFYFFLHKIKISTEYLENIVILFATLYSILYIIQIFAYPFQLFTSDVIESRGTIRLRIEGNGFLVLAYFLSLNRYLLNRKFINVILTITYFVILLLGGFRSLTLGTVLISVFMFVKLVPFNLKGYALLIFVAILFVGLFQIKGASKILNEMVNTSKDQIEQGENYIRVRQFEFFFKKFPQNRSFFILGSGLPGGSSSYNFLIQSYEFNLGMYWVDLGLFGFFIIIGPITLLGLLWYTTRAIFFKIPRSKLYLNAYFVFLLIVSVTTMEIFRPGIFTVEAIALYLIDKTMLENSNVSVLVKKN